MESKLSGKHYFGTEKYLESINTNTIDIVKVVNKTPCSGVNRKQFLGKKSEFTLICIFISKIMRLKHFKLSSNLFFIYPSLA